MRTRLLGGVTALIVAIIGTVLLLTYVNGADRRALANVETQDVYVVQKAVPAGTAVGSLSDAIAKKPMPKGMVPNDSVTDLSSDQSKVVAVALEPGETLLRSRLVDPASLKVPGRVDVPAGMQEVTIKLPIERVVGGVLAAGDTVGVIISLPKDDAAPSQTQLTYNKVLVTAVQYSSGASAASQSSDSSGGGLNSKSSAPTTDYLITLARPAGDVERIVYAMEFGKVYLSKEPTSAQESSGVVDRARVYR
jgi:pilus assembly protein CpaB